MKEKRYMREFINSMKKNHPDLDVDTTEKIIKSYCRGYLTEEETMRSLLDQVEKSDEDNIPFN